MKIIVTGGCGFIGSHVVEALVKRGDEVIVIDNLSTGKYENLQSVWSKVTLLEYTLNLSFVWENTSLKNADAIIHLAALPRIGRSMDNPVETYKVNVEGTVSILELARLLKVKKFIFGSSSSVYGQVDEEALPIEEDYFLNPRSPYAFQKLMGEELCRSYKQTFGVNATILRFFNVYGSRMQTEGAYKLVFTNWIEQIRQSKKLTIYGDGEQTRDFTYVDDIVKGILLALDTKQKIDLPINLCTNVETSVNELAELFTYDLNCEIEYIENPRPNEEKRKVGSNQRANELLGWKPYVSIVDGIERLKKEYEI